MKKSVVLSGLLLLTIASSEAQTTLAKWTFEISGPSYTNTPSQTGTTIGGVVPELGLGSAGGNHAAAAATWSSPVGNGSARSLSVNNWAVGDYWQFQTSTLGFSKISVSYDQTSSGTGPRDFAFAYSTDGSSFTTFSSYSITANSNPNAWNSGTNLPLHTYTADLSSLTVLDNQPTVYFRLVDNGTASANGGLTASGGTDRVDNFTVASIPEPSILGLALMGVAGLFMVRSRRS